MSHDLIWDGGGAGGVLVNGDSDYGGEWCGGGGNWFSDGGLPGVILLEVANVL